MRTHLILGEFWFPSSTHDSEVVGLAKHLRHSNTGIEICIQHLSAKWTGVEI
jgi:hypothetical protein